MNRFLKYFAVSAFFIGTAAVNSFAGDITQNGGDDLTTWTVAKEAVEGGTSGDPLLSAIGGKIADIEYTPSDIPLTTLSDAIVTYTLSAGKWMDVTSNVDLQLCDPDGNLVGEYDHGEGTNTIAFTNTNAGSGIVSNSSAYTIGYNGGADCDSSPAGDDIVISVPPGTTSQTLTVKAGITSTQVIHDEASGQLTEVTNMLSAAVSQKANAVIDFAEEFKLFYDNNEGDDADSVAVEWTVEALDDYGADVSVADDRAYSLVASDISGIDLVQVNGVDCTETTATKTYTCTVSNNDITDGETDEIVIFVDGDTVLGERTFTITAQYAFDDASMEDRTSANSTALLTTADAGKWTLRGTSVYVPLIKTVAGKSETLIKLQSSDTTAGANAVKAQVLATDGSLVSVSLGSITAGTPLDILGSAIKTAVTAAGKSVNGTTGFAAVLNINAGADKLFGYGIVQDGTSQKRLPLNITGSGFDGLDSTTLYNTLTAIENAL